MIPFAAVLLAWAAAAPARAQDTAYMINGSTYPGIVIGADQTAIKMYLPENKLSLTLGKEGIKYIVFPAGYGQTPNLPAYNVPAPAGSQQARFIFGKGQLFGAVEWFDPGDAYDTFELNLPVQGVTVNQFSDTAFTKSSGYGGRIGMLWPVKITAPIEVTHAALGFSVGYVHGPAADIQIDLASFNIGTGQGSVTANSNFKRLMLEFIKDIPLSSKNATFRLGASAGLAIGELTTNIDAPGLVTSGTLNPNQPIPGSTIESWTGFSWELSPAITFYRGGLEYWLGIRYSAFPKLQTSTGTTAFEWNSTGFYLGFGF